MLYRILRGGNYDIKDIPITKLEGSIIQYPILSSYVIKNVLLKLKTDIENSIGPKFDGFIAKYVEGNSGLIIEESGKIKVNLDGCLSIDSNKIVLNTDAGLKTVDDKLVISYSAPLSVNEDGELIINSASLESAGAVKLSNYSKGYTPNDTDVYSAKSAWNLVPPGVILPYAGNSTAPYGFEYCRGQSVDVSTMSEEAINIIAANWDTSYKPNQSTTIKMPNLQGMFLRGYDVAGTRDSGRIFASTQGAAAPNITGAFYVLYKGEYTEGAIYSDGTKIVGGAGGSGQYAYTHKKLDAHLLSGVYKDGLQEVRPVNRAINYIIKVR